MNESLFILILFILPLLMSACHQVPCIFNSGKVQEAMAIFLNNGNDHRR
ncbi:MAG: hypothetical protein JRI86_03855 [Deltaproteobacteria bacterium]|nr:hypothetical protein [Deltaproteobacteria bacterium]